MSNFEVTKQSLVNKTPVWEHFLRETTGELAQCKICRKVLKTSGGSTGSLHKHLKSIHSVVSNPTKRLSSETAADGEPSKKRSTSSIANYFVAHDNSMDAVLARLTAADGLPFSIFITSSEMRKSLLVRQFDVPKSANTIRSIVVNYGKKIQLQYKAEMQCLKTEGKRFSLTFDEWTSIRNRRYLNVTAHIKGKFWNLGLVRIRGSLPAESCIKLLEERLEIYGLNLHEDVIFITTDGASVMQKVGKLLCCDQQLCFAHAVHLAVCDVLYKKAKSLPKPNEHVDASDDYSDSDDDSDDGFQVESDEAVPELVTEFHCLIKKVRSVVKLFRKSPTKNDVLQKYVKEEFGKEIQLIIDIKTRWNSLYSMLQRFYELKSCILKSLIDLKSNWSFEEEELHKVHTLVMTLEPVKLGVEALCRRDATLLTADTTISFMLNNLGSSDFAIRLKESLARRINERRTYASSLLQFLHKQNQEYTCLNLDSSLKFERLPKTTIRAMVIKLSKLSENSNSSDSESENEVIEEDNCSMTLRERLENAIKTETISKITPKNRTSKNVTSIIKKEISIFEVEGSRGANLERCYNNLNSIPPASVESERVFSGCGHIVTKIRSSLNDVTLDILSFLRSHFKSEKTNK